MLLGTLGAILLGNFLTGKGAIRAGQRNLKESKFNGVYSRNNSPKIIDGAYVINLGEYNQ